MINLAGKLVTSRKIFMFYVVSLFVLWFSVRITGGYISKLSEHIFIYHQVHLVPLFDSLLFSEQIGTYLFGAQFLMLIILLLIMRGSNSVKSQSKSVLTETMLITLSSLNITVVILYILGLNVIYNPTKAALLLILIFVIIAAFSIAYNVMNESDDSDSFIKGKFVRAVLNRLRSFSFPYFPVAIILYFIVLRFYGTSVQDASTGWLVVQPVTKIIFFLIITLCIVYSLLGFAKSIKRKDELQRQMIYEQIFIVYTILIGLVLSYYAFALLFNYTLNSQDVMIVLIMAFLISGFFVKARYQ